MSDIMSMTKALTDDISQMVQQEQEVKNRIKNYKQLVLDRAARKESLAKALAEEAELIKQLEG